MSHSYSPHSNQENTFRLQQACKQFSLETDRLETVYSKLDHQFQSVQIKIQGMSTKLDGKLIELNFVTRYLEAILNHMSQGILFIDLNGIVTTYNPMASELLGYSTQQVLFRPFTDHFADDLFGFSVKEALKTKQAPKISFSSWNDEEKQIELEVETTFIGLDPYRQPVSVQSAQQPTIQGLLILLRNITEMRRLQVLANRQERFQELGELASIVAHEIRNPLGGIKGFASLLQQDLKDKPELHQMTVSIINGIESLNQFVTSILNYTRPFKPHFEAIDLVCFLPELIELIKADKSFNPHIKCEFKSDVVELKIPIDPSLLKSALLNLFINAFQAMPDGGQLTVNLQQTQKMVVIRIQDSGKGISEENLKKIFSPFFTTKASGSGFGLVEVNKVVQAHQGTIDVQSKLNEGTVFTIKIPFKLS